MKDREKGRDKGNKRRGKSRGGNRVGRAKIGPGQAKIGPVFSSQNFNSPAPPKNRAGRAK